MNCHPARPQRLAATISQGFSMDISVDVESTARRIISGSTLLSKPLLFALATVALLATSACKTMPKVAYKKITNPTDLDGTEFDQFVFQESELVIDGKKDDKGNFVPPLQLSAISVPAEHKSFKVAIYRRGSIGVKTNVVISKIENTEIPKEIGSEVVDSRVDMIKQIGSAMVSLAAVALSSDASTAIKFPRRIPISPLMTNVGKEGGSVTTSDKIEIELGALPQDAQSIDLLPFGKDTSSYYYAACRTAIIRVPICPSKAKSPCDQSAYTLPPVKISDPRYFQSVGLPQKGKITMHSQCGVSVSTEKDSGTSSNAEVAAALAAQIAAVKEAVDKQNKENGTKK